jgi:hypothetical protein
MQREWCEFNRRLAEQRTGLKLAHVKRHGEYGGHELGKVYYCGYWQQTYKVTAMGKDRVFGWCVESFWADEHYKNHSTSLIYGKDFEVVEGA